jgi:hypothetical protein
LMWLAKKPLLVPRLEKPTPRAIRMVSAVEFVAAQVYKFLAPAPPALTVELASDAHS